MLFGPPHEIDEQKLLELEDKFKTKNWTSQRYSHSDSFTEQILVIDEIGSLQELYLWGHCAFVGGSFKRRVHSVMEPLAAGCPVIVGPYHENNNEALHFQHKRLSGDVFVVSAVNNAREFNHWLKQECIWNSNEKLQNLLLDKTGASKKVFAWIDQYLKL